ncbi:MAG: lipopolysaccharide heptosyltransferase II [Desulfobulbaceae bacterium]|uniref:lipopolysaccharide heptosyltransferase II n=1 Tax=Candidatus Desulfobia pelagia TaxID=2841692 RepID=A0A8J6TFI2_9BACT|nr:lipopolysaccharide heptosyltransferase II [Candidatus Desulfobia pelagia]
MSKNLKKLPLKKILIRSTNWIGDAIMTTPAVRTIKENFPDAEITMLALPWMTDVFSASPYVDKIFSYDRAKKHHGIKGMLRLSQELRECSFDAAILLQNAFEAAFIAFLAGIPVRAGYRRDGRSLFLNHGITIRDETRKLHQVYYYQKMLEDLGLTCGSNDLFLQLPENEKEWAIEYKKKKDSGLVIGINPGAAYGPAKCWPAERYGELAALLHKKTGAHFVVFGTEADTETGNIIAGHDKDIIDNMAGKTTLARAMSLIDICDVFVTNDSGLMHVAAALQRPLVAIFGSTDAVATGPFSENALVLQKKMSCQPCLKKECSKGHFRCMLDISVEEVAEEVIRHIDITR